MGDLIWIVVFLILFTVIRKVLKEQMLLEKGSPIISLCVSLLCVVGMQRMFTAGKESFDLMLVPYAALGISILFMLLLMFIGRLPKKGKPRREDTQVQLSKPSNTSISPSERERRLDDESSKLH